MIRLILLGFLNYQPMTGYDLKQNIDHSVSHFWHAHHSQIYTTLRQMETEGLLTSEFIYAESQPDRRVYSLTDAGRAELKSLLDQPLTEMSPVKEELLVRVFFSAQRDMKNVLAELYLQRDLHQKKFNQYMGMVSEGIEKYKDVLPQLQADTVFWKISLNMGIRYEEIYLAWLHETIMEIEAF